MTFYLLSESNEKLKVSADKVSATRKEDIESIQTTDEYGNDIFVDEDCTNNLIDLEECVIKNNRYQPCPPPERKISEEYRDLYNERLKEFISILESNGYEIVQVEPLYEGAGEWKVTNFDEKYKEHVGKFLSEIVENPEKKLPQSLENYQRDYNIFRNQMRQNMYEHFSRFENRLNDVTCKNEISGSTDLFESLKLDIYAIQNMLSDTKRSLQTSQNSLKTFIDQFPQETLEKCDDEKKFVTKINQKLQLLRLLQWNCYE